MSLPFPHEHNKPLSEFCTFGIGGPARYFTVAKSVEEIQAILSFTFKAGLPHFILGKGSNSLFDDAGFPGLVIHNRIDYLKNDENRFVTGSGYSFARLGQQTARLGWRGLEFAAGIPATVGGALYMNAGANGQETHETLATVLYVTENGDLIHVAKSDLNFSYRTSSFQSKKGIIVEATFFLGPGEDVPKKQKEIIRTRLKTQPYQDKSAGCAFRNPGHNVFAGKLIEECGLKGMEIGGAQVSTMHANFIVNRGGARARDVLDLIAKIKEIVYKEKGILLEEEIRYIGIQS